MSRLLQIRLHSYHAIPMQEGGWHRAGASPRPLPGIADESEQLWWLKFWKPGVPFLKICLALLPALQQQRNCLCPSTRSCCCTHCLVPSKIFPLCGLSVLGWFETSRTDLCTLVGEACADAEKISCPHGKISTVNREAEKMGPQNSFRDITDTHKTIPSS